MRKSSVTYQNERSKRRAPLTALNENIKPTLELSKSLMLVTKKLFMF